MAGNQVALSIYSVANYNFGTKAAKVEKDANVSERLARMEQKYKKEGVRRSVDGVMLVFEHNHPHVLLLQLGNAFFKLPGGRLRPGEDEVEGLKRKLANNMAPEAASLQPSWDVGECIATFWRPNFDVALYPYLPAHITRPKEVKKLFLVPMPERCYLAVPRNAKLLAVPLFEIHENSARYGPVIAALPYMVSRFRLTMAGAPLPAALHMPPPGPAEAAEGNGPPVQAC